MATTLVIQSHTSPVPSEWINACLRSVRAWASGRKYDYRFLGDELFDTLPVDILQMVTDQPVVASDLARLKVLGAALAEGYKTVIWCDADFLVFAPDRLDLTADEFGFGREVWIQRDKTTGKTRAYIKIHNAFLFFRQGNKFLEFYIDAAKRLLRKHGGPFAPQFIGPKFLTALHNIVQYPVVETAAMLSPTVMQELLDGGGPGLTLFRLRSTQPPAAVNLCGSLNARKEISDQQISEIIELLLAEPALLAPVQQDQTGTDLPVD